MTPIITIFKRSYNYQNVNRVFQSQINTIGLSHSFSSVTLKHKIAIVGSGWSGYRLALDLDKSKYEVIVVSPLNHFLFTPLLPSTAVGTLEFRAIQEPIRTIPNLTYFQASVNRVNFKDQTIECVDNFLLSNATSNPCHTFNIKYDSIILAPGCENNTFGVNGVLDNPNVFFLKQLQHSRAIRNRLIECFEIASSPNSKLDDIKNLLRFCVVGGGPTSIEFASELYDFMKKDVTRWYPDLFQYVSIVVVEASDHILNSFNKSLSEYVEVLFKSRNIELITGVSVKEIDGTKAKLSNNREINFGLMVWNTGIKQTKLISGISSETLAKSKNGRILVDGKLRIIKKLNAESSPEYYQNCFALGDCACDYIKPLPQLAQVASQQAKYLASSFNQLDISQFSKVADFKYSHLGSMASIGQWKGIYDSNNIDIGSSKLSNGPPIKGFTAFLLWRAAYLTKQVSITNKILILMFWFKSAVFGRDISRF